MRSLFLAVVLVTACAHASGPHPVNVAAVRNQISGTIKAQSGGRTVTSMGKVTADRAVVYTTKPDGSRAEETWVKHDSSWKLEASTAIAGTPKTDGI